MKYSYCAIILTISMVLSFSIYAGNTFSTTEGKNSTSARKEIEIAFKVREESSDSSDDEKQHASSIVEDSKEERSSKKSDSAKNKKLMNMKKWPTYSAYDITE